MTKQEIFDKVWERAKDKRAAVRNSKAEGRQCLYRDPRRGIACFAGILISDGEYVKGMEGRAFPELVEAFPGLRRYRRQARFIRELQMVHDCEPIKTWQRHLREIAKEFKVKVPK